MRRVFLIVGLGLVALLAVAASASAVNAFDHGFLGTPLEEVGDVTNVTDPRWGGGIDDFSSTSDANDILRNVSLDNFALNDTPDRLSDDLTVVGVVNVTEAQLDTVASPNLLVARGNEEPDASGGELRYFAILPSVHSDVDGVFRFTVENDDCSSSLNFENTLMEDGFFHFAVRFQNETAGSWDVEVFRNGTSENSFSLASDPCVNLNQYFLDDFVLGCDNFEPNTNCGLGNHFPGQVFDLRVFQRALSDEEIEDLADANGEQELGDEAALYTFGDDITGLVNPPPPPEPVDFADGIQDAAAAWGFRTSESQMFFALAWIGITTVGVGVGTKLMSSGRTKNALIAGSALIVGVFFVFVDMLRFWQLATAAILAGFTIFGGPREVKNTWQEATKAGREMVQETQVVAQGEGDREVIEVDVDEDAETPEAADDAAEPAGGLEVTGAVPEPDLSPVTGQDASFVETAVVTGPAPEPDRGPRIQPEGGDE